MQLDKPGIGAEARAVFDRHEAAVAADDDAVPDAAFRADPRHARRVRKRVRIVTSGDDFAATHLEYERVETGLIGRETRIMARIPGRGRRVVPALVSPPAPADAAVMKPPA